MRRDIRSAEAAQYRHLYKRKAWLIVRAEQLSRQPLCEWCLKRGRVEAATECHHADPAQKLKEETFYLGPFVSLCKPCHDSEAQEIEVNGFSSRVGIDGWPIDAAHPANKPQK